MILSISLTIAPPRVDSRWKIGKVFASFVFFCFLFLFRSMEKMPQMAPNRAGRIFFLLTNPDLANILGRTDLNFENFHLFDFLDPNFLDFQVPKIWISRLPKIWIPGLQKMAVLCMAIQKMAVLCMAMQSMASSVPSSTFYCFGGFRDHL